MKRILFLLLLFIASVWSLCSTIHFSVYAVGMDELQEKELRAYANENNTWVICYQQGARTGNFYQYDATDEYLYFSYSKDACVDVYDTQGTFLYSIIFPERQNGGMSVRCENSQVYISTKDNILYIFSGNTEVEHMDDDIAREKGYDFFWFYDNDPHITVDTKWIRWYNESGDVINQIATPSVIKNTIPPSNVMMTTIPLIGALLFLVIFIIHVLTQKVSKSIR